ncbi:hypothetical protein TSUD_179920 [Trifolium subterraneum]|uniref:Glycosyl transferase CAP10 domain-containing protein n=1 Tax=Trifolium subterraneum TaxID=3900 RepID=A0A2Z6NZH9_TRISU|nr:hypothetical protein TSUD_179920 [Trifolium subterraneum]
MVESGKNISQLRIVIKQGKTYVETYGDSYQTRDLFTVWGIVQLLRLYPGRVPDLELLFETGDKTVLDKQKFQAVAPPPIFSYCGQNNALDIVFPDWSFWGWAETGIKPWEKVLKDIHESNKKIKWKDRVPYAFWKGNTHVSPTRFKLRMCNNTDQHDWNAHIYSLHWSKEIKKGFKNTKLEDQCTHRYKIYAEGVSWSAEAIGREGTKFIEENVKMKLVYDYMLHLLTEYAKLLKFEPTIPPQAFEVCSENLACPVNGIWRECMIESLVKSPSDTPPCAMKG